MNKYELACRVAKDAGKPLTSVIPIINSLFNIMADTILADEKINIVALGSFHLKVRKQRNGYDPHRNISIVIPEGVSLKFETSPSLQKKITQKYSQNVIQGK